MFSRYQRVFAHPLGLDPQNDVRPDIPGLRDVEVLTYEDLFSLTTLPSRLLVIGAGPVGMEMSQAFARLGSSVTIVQRAPRLLTVADADCSEAMADVFRGGGHPGAAGRDG